MKTLKGLVAGLIIGAVAAACSVTVASTSNDTVLHEDSYDEFYKQEGNGDKNYLYTATYEVDAPAPGKCVVVTGASERAIAISCNTNGR